MRLIVDAWNVLHVEGILPPGLAGLNLAGLGRLIEASCWAEAHTTLACDGRAKPRPEAIPSRIHVVWSGTREADDVIEDLIARSSSPKRLVVVSSDNRIRRAAKRRRCKHLRSDQFLRSLLGSLSRPQAVAERSEPKSDDDWASIFDVTADEIDRIEHEADASTFEELLPEEQCTQRPLKKERPQRAVPPPADPIEFPPALLEEAMRIARGLER